MNAAHTHPKETPVDADAIEALYLGVLGFEQRADHLVDAYRIRSADERERVEQERDAALADAAKWSQAAQAAGDHCRQVEQERDRLAAEIERLRGELDLSKRERVAAVILGSREEACPKPFALYRHEDVTGASGTGLVATGTEFDDGTVVIRWRGAHASTVVWPSLDDAVKVHGHDGRTRVVWLAEDIVELSAAIEQEQREVILAETTAAPVSSVEPEQDEACCTVLADGRHQYACPERCQDCEGDPDGPMRCRCRPEPAVPEQAQPRTWRDKFGQRWRDAEPDHLVMTHDESGTELAEWEPLRRSKVEHQNGPLTVHCALDRAGQFGEVHVERLHQIRRDPGGYGMEGVTLPKEVLALPAAPWYVSEGRAGFWTGRTVDEGHTLLAECPSFEAAERVSEGLQALTRLCQCKAVLPAVSAPVSTEDTDPLAKYHQALADVERLRERSDGWQADANQYAGERDEARAEVDQLRGALSLRDHWFRTMRDELEEWLPAPVSSVEPEPRCGEGDPVCDESVPDGHCSGHGQVGPCPMTEHDATCCDHWRRHDEHRAPVDGCPWCPDPEPAEVVASIRETHGLLGAVLATQALEAEQPAVPEQAQPRVWKRGDPEPNANRVRANNGIVFSSCGLGDKPWFATYESGGDGRWYSWGDLVNPNTGPTPLVEVVEAPAGQDGAEHG